MFASSAYVPVASLPQWLQVVAAVNPLSYTVDAARGLALGQPDGAALGRSLLIAAVLAAVSLVGATIAYRRIDR
jgi:ABC-2 type transport system permease protein